MKIAVVILNWNGKALLAQFLPKLIEYSSAAKIYVADNASTDDSVSFVKQHFPSVSLIQNQENGGFAKGYNDALKAVEEDLYVLLNSDVEVTPNWLDPMVNVFKTQPKTAIIQPKIRAFHKPDFFEYAGAAGGFIDQYGYPFCRGRIFDQLEKDQQQYDNNQPIFWASGACLAIRKKVYWELGGLDEDYFAHQEEIDLCWRAFNAGYQTYFVSDSTVFHVGGATLSAMNPKKTYLNFRNSLFNLIKNVPSPKVFPIVFIRMVLDGIAALRFLISGKLQHFWAVFKAHIHFYLKIGKMWKKRGTKNKKKNYASLNSIVLAYFIKKRRTFKSLKF